MKAIHRGFIETLESLGAIDDEALEPALYELVDRLEGEDPAPVVPAVFSFLEEHPYAGLGNPGPLVHLLERTFPGVYENLLLDSLSRRPVPHTTWMANRLLNSPDLEVRFVPRWWQPSKRLRVTRLRTTPPESRRHDFWPGRAVDAPIASDRS